MRRILTALGLIVVAIAPAQAVTFTVSPDVPTDDPGGPPPVFLSSDIARNDGGIYTLSQSLPPGTPVAAVHRLNKGPWLFTVDAPVELPPGSGTFLETRDVIRFDGTLYTLFFGGAARGVPPGVHIDAVFLDGGDNGDPILSFDVPATILGTTYEPADLVRYSAAGFTLYFDASAASPPIPLSTNVTGADRRHGRTVMTFDVPTTLGAATYLPGELVSWDGVAFASFNLDPAWPISSIADSCSFLAAPGMIPPTLTVAKSGITPGDLKITWSASCSVGGEDYGIYEGALGSWYTHTWIDCSDNGGDMTEEVTPAAGSRYYLVVPSNPNDEGSYGKDSIGTERPVGTAVCIPTQELEPCP